MTTKAQDVGIPASKTKVSLENLWDKAEFAPDPAQEQAIRHPGGPLYLPAGPGSGKTKVILWRTLDLIVFRGLSPDQIFLSTFTEKAAFQLREGLRALLGLATNATDIPYDISRMYVGTVHSLCQRLIIDRRFYKDRKPTAIPSLLDELAQYFHLSDRRRWDQLLATAALGDEPHKLITNFLAGFASESRHQAVTHCIALFNRLSEECFDPTPEAIAKVPDESFRKLLSLYAAYKQSLHEFPATPLVDFSLLQQRAFQAISATPTGDTVFKHVIVDEYQDTNSIQERLFFKMAAGSKNITVVGDDDQALYRFRGATVENFVQFPERCQQHLGIAPEKIPLSTNYRSRKQIVSFYTDFIAKCNWKATGTPPKFYRVTDKNIRPNSTDGGTSVIATSACAPEKACREVASLVCRLLEQKKVQDPNQIAFLFPSFKYRGQINTQVQRMKHALETAGLRVYAPRAGRFLEVEEATAIFGIFLHIFGQPKKGEFGGADYAGFHGWMDAAHAKARELQGADHNLRHFVEDRQAEIARAVADYQVLTEVIGKRKWKPEVPYNPDTMKRPLYDAPGLSDTAKRSIASSYFDVLVRKRIQEGNPFTLGYILRRATSLDWNVLDLFYRICGFDHFKAMFALAERGEDEGPVCNLGLASQYLSRYMDEYTPILTAPHLAKEGPKRLLFMSFLYALYRLGESEFEDAQDPFPKGRIPFLTIHQAKGLEFPVVVLGNPRKDDRGPQRVEQIVRPLLPRDGEPLDRTAEFDIMRMFYVALSRAKNLLVVAHYKGQGIRVNEPFKQMLHDNFPRIPSFDLKALPAATTPTEALPQNYSYTSDYLLYQTCPRQYMIFRKYGFVPSRSQTMLFGSVVHKTLDDLHQFLIARRAVT